MPKIIIIATEGLTTDLLYSGLISRTSNLNVIYEDPESKKAVIKRRLKKIGWAKTIGQILFKVIIHPLIPNRKKRIQSIIDDSHFKNDTIPTSRIKRVDSVYNIELLALISSENPDLIVINGTRILPNSLLSKISCPIVNIHVGITPQYRGVHGGFWSIKENNPQLFGVTLHYVDKGIDTGGIIAQKTLVPNEFDNFKTYPILQYTAGIQLLLDNLDAIINRAIFIPSELTKSSKLHYHPTLIEYLF